MMNQATAALGGEPEFELILVGRGRRLSARLGKAADGEATARSC